MKKFFDLKTISYIIFLFFLQFFFSSLKLPLSIFPTNIKPNNNKFSNLKYDFIHNNYYISLSPSNGKLNVNAKFYIKLDNYIDTIKINLYNNLTIKYIKVNNILTKFKHQLDTIYIPITTKDNTISLELSYYGKPSNKGIGSFLHKKYNNYYTISTINEPFYASTWLACADRNDDKVLLDITIEVDTPYIAISNGQMIKHQQIKDKNIYHWKTSHPIAPYLITLYVGKYYTYSDSVLLSNKKYLPIYYYSLKSKNNYAKIALEDQKNCIAFFENIFGEYPFYNEKYAFVDILWEGGAIENQTATGIGHNFMIDTRQAQLMLIHELAHQWWGNAITIDNWNDIWLNEGLARYSEALAIEHFQSKEDYIDFMKNMIYPYNGRLAYPLDNLFSLMVYNKGAWIFHMLRNKLGDSPFFNFLKTYYYTYRYKNINTKKFKRFLEDFTKSNFDKFFDDWILKAKHIPFVTYNYKIIDNNNNYYKIKINLNQYSPDGYIFDLPIEILFADNQNKVIKNFNFNQKNSIFETVINFYPKKIELDPNTKILMITK